MPKTDNPLALLQSFATALTDKFSIPVPCNPEDQLKGPVGTLVEGSGSRLGLAVVTITEVHEKEISGRPDMGVSVSGLLTGHIELKAPGKGADPKKFKGPDKVQREKFRDLPNLLYTDGNEWAIYRSGERARLVAVRQGTSGTSLGPGRHGGPAARTGRAVRKADGRGTPAGKNVPGAHRRRTTRSKHRQEHPTHLGIHSGNVV